jgi:hypothetical protein
LKRKPGITEMEVVGKEKRNGREDIGYSADLKKSKTIIDVYLRI